MDETCENCGLCETRERVVHGYGEVDADFLFVGEMPDERAEQDGVPFAGTELWSVLAELGFARAVDGPEPDLDGAYLTYLARCRHPDRGPEHAEVAACDPFLTAEVRMINPEILVPVGDRALEALAAEHTTKRPDSLDVQSRHACSIRGRGFELVPAIDPETWTGDQRDGFVDSIRRILERDYRQTKGRRGREERDRQG